MKDYDNAVEKVMAFLDENSYCNSIVKSNRSCFRLLRDYLAAKGVTYTACLAEEWFQSISKVISKSYAGYYRTALIRLQDVFETGDVRNEHYSRSWRGYSILDETWRREIDGYISSRANELAGATLDNHKTACARFMVYLQENGIHAVSDISYDTLIQFYRSDVHNGRYGKTAINAVITAYLQYLYGRGDAPYGFTIIIHYLIFGKEAFWESISEDTRHNIQDILGTHDTVPASKFIEYKDISEDIHRMEGYGKTTITGNRAAVELLYLFLDMNGYPYSPEIAMLWLGEVRRFCSPTEAYRMNRILCLIASYHESSEMPLSAMFREKKRTFELIPEWAAEGARGYVSDRMKEGWAHSTLDMIRSCICRFVGFLDRAGIRNYREIAVLHVKRFHQENTHRTQEGKNAYSGRIRQFLLYLGLNGYLSNPMLFAALARSSTPAEHIVITLTKEEMDSLTEGIKAENSPLSLRKKAMLLLGLKMGMRSCDIVRLKFTDVDWEHASIRFVQAKTQVEVNLPMPAEVGNALFRYITEERGIKDCPQIFLSEHAPGKPVGRSACGRALDTALPDRNVPGSGFHVTRKTYATGLLRCGVGITQVADALGQRGTASVHKYLSLDEDRMRLCALSLSDCGTGRGWPSDE